MKPIVRRTGRGAESSFAGFTAKTPPSALASGVKRVPDYIAITEFAIERAIQILTTAIFHGLMLHQTSPEY